MCVLRVILVLIFLYAVRIFFCVAAIIHTHSAPPHPYMPLDFICEGLLGVPPSAATLFSHCMEGLFHFFFGAVCLFCMFPLLHACPLFSFILIRQYDIRYGIIMKQIAEQAGRHICRHIHRHIPRHIHRHIARHIGRQIDRQTNR